MKRLFMLLGALPMVLLSLLVVVGELRASTGSGEEILKEPLSRLENRIPQRDCLSPDVSKVDVAWHLDHTLKVINGIYDALEGSDPGDYRFRPNLARMAVFAQGKIARGKAKAPASVTPPETILTEDLQSQLETVRANLERLGELPAKSHFKHPVLGTLHKKNAKRFLEIHTNHHLSIVDDIVRECSAGT